VESLPRTEAPPPATVVGAQPGRPDNAHLADPRALQILSTEHWGQLTARSLVYNETFTRGSMFLTFLSASLVALGFVYQGGGADFVYILIAILALDLFVGLTTLARINNAGMEEFRALQAINRIRHAYLEIVPTLETYLSDSQYDDPESVLSVYSAGPDTRAAGPAASILHGLTTMPGLISVLDSALVGALVAAVIAAAGSEVRVVVVGGLVGGLLAAVVLTVAIVRVFSNMERWIVPRFPAPGAGPIHPPGRRNT
jgi:hypothetical protein